MKYETEKFMTFLKRQKYEPSKLVGGFMNIPKDQKLETIKFIRKYCIS